MVTRVLPGGEPGVMASITMRSSCKSTRSVKHSWGCAATVEFASPSAAAMSAAPVSCSACRPQSKRNGSQFCASPIQTQKETCAHGNVRAGENAIQDETDANRLRLCQTKRNQKQDDQCEHADYKQAGATTLTDREHSCRARLRQR
jgi:hypothetical protein